MKRFISSVVTAMMLCVGAVAHAGQNDPILPGQTQADQAPQQAQPDQGTKVSQAQQAVQVQTGKEALDQKILNQQTINQGKEQELEYAKAQAKARALDDEIAKIQASNLPEDVSSQEDNAPQADYVPPPAPVQQVRVVPARPLYVQGFAPNPNWVPAQPQVVYQQPPQVIVRQAPTVIYQQEVPVQQPVYVQQAPSAAGTIVAGALIGGAIYAATRHGGFYPHPYYRGRYWRR